MMALRWQLQDAQQRKALERHCFPCLGKKLDVITHIITNRGRVVSNAILHRDKFDRNIDKAVRYNFGK